MWQPANRRDFLRSAAAGGALLGVGDFGWLSQLQPVSAAEAALPPSAVQFHSDIEPIVRLLEDTSRDKLLEVVAQRIQEGLEYRDVLAALLLAGIRNIQPRPAVGFKFHAVLVVNSAHLASQASPDSDRWLPIFWALDEFKDSQAKDVNEGDWTMGAVDESAVPSAEKAEQAFIDAMDKWDAAAADAAAAGLARHVEPARIFELFARYGARDFRSIGHKAIYVANSWRTLNVIGWQHAEPILRSLAYALLNHDKEPNPASSDLTADRPGRRNAETAKQFPENWQAGAVDSKATESLLSVLREGSDVDASAQVVEALQAGVSPQSLFDACFVGSGEFLMRQPGIVALHAVTTTNALYHAYQLSTSDETRRMLLLQIASFLPLFREAMTRRGNVDSSRVTELEPAELPADPAATIEGLFRDVSREPRLAASKLLAYLNEGRSVPDLINTARRLIFQKGNNAHDYKFSSAVFEDFENISPDWRNRFLATSVFNLRGLDAADNDLVARTRAALGG